MARIFVSYRRQDSPYVAATLRDHIERRFGADSVFFDIDNIPVGADFRKHIEAAVSECGALLVLIGDKWLMPEERTGKNRLFEPRDYVRMEIEAALARGIPVVPVLVEAAEMPTAGDLPESIGDLIFRNAAEVRAGRDFQNHMTRLVDGLWSLLGPASTTASQSSPPPAPEETPPARPATTAVAVVKKNKPQAQHAKNSGPHALVAKHQERRIQEGRGRRGCERSADFRL